MLSLGERAPKPEARRVMRIPVLVSIAAAIGLLAGATPNARQSSPASAQQPASQQPASQQPAQPQQQPPPPTQDPQQPQPPRIRSGINYIRVDIIVSDKTGKPVLDLKQDEFKIKEDGKPQSIESFQIVEVNPMTQTEKGPISEIRSIYDEEREAQKPDVRLFLILLDDYHVRRGNDLSVKKPLIDFIENQIGPADMVAIMYPLTPITDLNFTRNRASLVNAIEHFEGRRFNYTPRNEFEEKYAYYPAQTVEMVRNQVTMGAIKGAAIKLGGMREGRKSLIFVSEGFTGLLPPQLNDPVAAQPGLGNSARNNPNAVNSDRAEFLSKVDMISDLSEIFREVNRTNTSIYALDPRGLAPFEYDINQGVGLQVDKQHLDASLDNLRELAENTDGRAIVNRNDLAKGMRQIILDSSGYYLIGYNSSQAPTDGKFHKIDVDVTRKGVEVRHRKGYWAYTADDVARATTAKPEAPPAVSAALATLADPPRGRPARFWIGTAKAANGKSSVTFVWEPIPPVPGERRDEPPAQVTVTALAQDGRPLYRGKVPEQPTTPPPAGGATALAPSATTFDAPPGRIQLRLSVQNAGGQVMDSATQDVTVPDYTGVQVSFGTPRLYRARTPRDVQLITANPNPVPTADRAFSRTERIVVRADAYGPGGVTPTVTARLLNRAGTAMSDVQVQPTASGAQQMDLALSALAAGEYLLELNAKADAGSAQEVIAFRIK
jgi:VWFA-related protein